MPLANMFPFSKAALNCSMLIPSSSIRSFAGLPEKRRENLWSKSMRSFAICFRSDSYVLRMARLEVPLTTLATFQPRLYARWLG